jgi:16S rRNA (guanine(966)-N(2))-methyltransferase RsmD
LQIKITPALLSAINNNRELQMRIISGKYKGRKLLSPKGDDVRPTLDRVKESLFDILQTNVFACNFLDLFCGSGQIGLEALSRGCGRVFFCDNSPSSIKLLKENLKILDEDDTAKAECFFCYAKKCLKELKEQQVKLDIIYIDPPFALSAYEEALDLIYEFQLLRPGGIIVIEQLFEKDLKIPPDKYIIKDKRKYGTVSLCFLIAAN